MAENIIQTQGLTVYYGPHRGIIDVDLQVRQGEIYGFLGPNGAGKTTTLRVLADIIRPTRGQATIFGLDCQQDGVAIRRRLSYLPGELNLPPNLKGYEFLDLVGGLHGNQVESDYRADLCQRLDLDTGRRIREYSRGNKQKLGLISALMGRPELMLLDEPTSGLDPLVQQSVLQVVREARSEGRTVLFSSHILSEVQAVCDRVGIIREGRLVKVERVDALTAQPFQRLRLRFETTPDTSAFAIEGVRELSRDIHGVFLEVRDNLPLVLEKAAACTITDIESQPVTLEEVFLAYYGGNGGNGGNDHA
jgi:ABC-2 type transport system ATP-binding protein